MWRTRQKERKGEESEIPHIGDESVIFLMLGYNGESRLKSTAKVQVIRNNVTLLHTYASYRPPSARPPHRDAET